MANEIEKEKEQIKGIEYDADYSEQLSMTDYEYLT